MSTAFQPKTTWREIKIILMYRLVARDAVFT
jgi:hypothetical protein